MGNRAGLNAPDAIMRILVGAQVIPRDYTGQVILHVGSGGLCNIEKRDKSGMMEQLRGMNEMLVLLALKEG